MKIVNLKEFLTLPAGTLFYKYSPIMFGDLCIKSDNMGESDFLVQHVNQVKAEGSAEHVDVMFAAEEKGVPFDMDLDCEGRDGHLHDTQMFAVYEEHDHYQLIERLTKAYAERRGQRVKEIKITFEPKKQYTPPVFKEDDSLEQLIEELSLDDSPEPKE